MLKRRRVSPQTLSIQFGTRTWSSSSTLAGMRFPLGHLRPHVSATQDISKIVLGGVFRPHSRSVISLGVRLMYTILGPFHEIRGGAVQARSQVGIPGEQLSNIRRGLEFQKTLVHILDGSLEGQDSLIEPRNGGLFPLSIRSLGKANLGPSTFCCRLIFGINTRPSPLSGGFVVAWSFGGPFPGPFTSLHLGLRWTGLALHHGSFVFFILGALDFHVITRVLKHLVVVLGQGHVDVHYVGLVMVPVMSRLPDPATGNGESRAFSIAWAKTRSRSVRLGGFQLRWYSISPQYCHLYQVPM